MQLILKQNLKKKHRFIEKKVELFYETTKIMVKCVVFVLEIIFKAYITVTVSQLGISIFIYFLFLTPSRLMVFIYLPFF